MGPWGPGDGLRGSGGLEPPSIRGVLGWQGPPSLILLYPVYTPAIFTFYGMNLKLYGALKALLVFCSYTLMISYALSTVGGI